MSWRRAKPAGSFQEDVWFRLVPGSVLGRDYRIEPTLHADVRNLFHDDITEAATGHRHWEFPFILPDDGSNGLNFDEQMHAVEERLFFFLSDNDCVERQIHPR